jgi:hypothetical protein
LRLTRRRRRALSHAQEKPKGGARGHAGFSSKALLLTLLEVDPSGKSAAEVGTVQLNLADFASTDPSARVQRTLPVQLKPIALGARPARHALPRTGVRRVGRTRAAQLRSRAAATQGRTRRRSCGWW